MPKEEEEEGNTVDVVGVERKEGEEDIVFARAFGGFCPDKKPQDGESRTEATKREDKPTSSILSTTSALISCTQRDERER